MGRVGIVFLVHDTKFEKNLGVVLTPDSPLGTPLLSVVRMRPASVGRRHCSCLRTRSSRPQEIVKCFCRQWVTHSALLDNSVATFSRKTGNLDKFGEFRDGCGIVGEKAESRGTRHVVCLVGGRFVRSRQIY